jgi:hypothetical protein
VHLFRLGCFLLELQLQLLPIFDGPDLLEFSIHLLLALSHLKEHLLLLFEQLLMPCVFYLLPLHLLALGFEQVGLDVKDLLLHTRLQELFELPLSKQLLWLCM